MEELCIELRDIIIFYCIFNFKYGSEQNKLFNFFILILHKNNLSTNFKKKMIFTYLLQFLKIILLWLYNNTMFFFFF